MVKWILFIYFSTWRRWVPITALMMSTLVQVMPWYRQASGNPYLVHCWPISMTPYRVTIPQLFTHYTRIHYMTTKPMILERHSCNTSREKYFGTGLSQNFISMKGNPSWEICVLFVSLCLGNGRFFCQYHLVYWTDTDAIIRLSQWQGSTTENMGDGKKYGFIEFVYGYQNAFIPEF